MNLISRLLAFWEMFLEMLDAYAVIGRRDLSPQLIPIF